MKKQIVTIFCAIALSACTEKEPLCVSSECEYGTCVDDACVLWQTAFIGSYTGNTVCGSMVNTDVVIIQPGTTDNGLIIDDLTATVTSATTITISSQNTTTVNGQTATIYGNGVIASTGSLTVNLYLTVQGNYQACTFTGNKN